MAYVNEMKGSKATHVGMKYAGGTSLNRVDSRAVAWAVELGLYRVRIATHLNISVSHGIVRVIVCAWYVAGASIRRKWERRQAAASHHYYLPGAPRPLSPSMSKPKRIFSCLTSLSNFGQTLILSGCHRGITLAARFLKGTQAR